MRYPWGRIAGAAVLAEIVPILALVALVAALGPRDFVASNAGRVLAGWLGGSLAGAPTSHEKLTER
jgi:hypothetical protein